MMSVGLFLIEGDDQRFRVFLYKLEEDESKSYLMHSPKSYAMEYEALSFAQQFRHVIESPYIPIYGSTGRRLA